MPTPVAAQDAMSFLRVTAAFHPDWLLYGRSDVRETDSVHLMRSRGNIAPLKGPALIDVEARLS